MRPMRALLVLPTYEEAENLVEVLDRVRAASPDTHVLVVDDASPDGTADLAEAHDAVVGGVEVLRRPAKSGLGSAYRDGFRWGLERGYDVLLEMDSDLSHDPAALPALLGAVEHGADLVIGSRYVPGGSIPKWSWHRRWLSTWGNRYAAGVLGLAVNDSTAGYRAYRATTLAQIDLDGVVADGYGFQIEMTYQVVRRGLRVVEVPIAFADRIRGTSKMSGRIVVEALLLVTWWGIRDRILRRAPAI
jgi:glycosyltransferase involved in cell wall biosynthesis